MNKLATTCVAVAFTLGATTAMAGKKPPKKPLASPNHVWGAVCHQITSPGPRVGEDSPPFKILYVPLEVGVDGHVKHGEGDQPGLGHDDKSLDWEYGDETPDVNDCVGGGDGGDGG